jgi:ElaB/YqjD/DUF883 family membrane-anchored ribosome-binding protein
MREYEPPYTGASGITGRRPDMDPDDRDPEEIRVEIEQTRTEMSGTIDAIQQRLAPDVLAEQAKDVARDATEQAKSAAQDLLQDAIHEVKDAAIDVTQHAVREVKEAARDVTHDAKDAAWDATIGRAETAVSSVQDTAKGVGATVIDTIKQNPIPAALAAASLYWLYRQRSTQPGRAGSGSSMGMYQSPGFMQSQGRTPQAYPIRTGYASQAEREEMTRNDPYRDRGTGVGTGTGFRGGMNGGMDGGASRQYDQHQSDGGMMHQAGQMASGAMETATDVASDTMHSAGRMMSSASGTAMDTGSGFMELVQRNPIPAALIALGAGWLYMNRSTPQPDYRAHSGTHYRYGPERMGRSGDQNASGYQGSYDTSSESDGGITGTARQLAGQAGEMAGSVGEQVSDMAGSMMHQTRRAPSQLQQMIEENPMMTAALAATLGGVVGLALPATQTENQLMGRTRSKVVGRAQEMTSETVEKVQEVAQEVTSTAREEAKTRGLTV